MVPRRMHWYWYHDFRIVQSTDLFLLFPHDSPPMGVPFPLFYPHIQQLQLNTLLKHFIFEESLRVSTLYVFVCPEPKRQEASPVHSPLRAHPVFQYFSISVFCQAPASPALRGMWAISSEPGPPLQHHLRCHSAHHPPGQNHSHWAQLAGQNDQKTKKKKKSQRGSTTPWLICYGKNKLKGYK